MRVRVAHTFLLHTTPSPLAIRHSLLELACERIDSHTIRLRHPDGLIDVPVRMFLEHMLRGNLIQKSDSAARPAAH